MRAARIDNNQNDIISDLESIPGVTVARKHDDILVGYRGKTFWFEIKNPNVIKKSGTIGKNALKKSQVKIRDTWTGHYSIVWESDQIIKEIGIASITNK